MKQPCFHVKIQNHPIDSQPFINLKTDVTQVAGIYHISQTIHGTGIFTYIYHTNQPNVGKCTIHGSYGYTDNIDIPYPLITGFFFSEST